MDTTLYSKFISKPKRKGTKRDPLDIEKVWLWKPGEGKEASNWYVVQNPSKEYDTYLYADTKSGYCLHRLKAGDVRFEILGDFTNAPSSDFRTICFRSSVKYRDWIVNTLCQLSDWVSMFHMDTYAAYCRDILGFMHFESRPAGNGNSENPWEGYQECWAYRRQPELNENSLKAAIDAMDQWLRCFHESCESMCLLEKVDSSCVCRQEAENYLKADAYMEKTMTLFKNRVKKLKFTKRGDLCPESIYDFLEAVKIINPLAKRYDEIVEYFSGIERRVLKQKGILM